MYRYIKASNEYSFLITEYNEYIKKHDDEIDNVIKNIFENNGFTIEGTKPLHEFRVDEHNMSITLFSDYKNPNIYYNYKGFDVDVTHNIINIDGEELHISYFSHFFVDLATKKNIDVNKSVSDSVAEICDEFYNELEFDVQSLKESLIELIDEEFDFITHYKQYVDEFEKIMSDIEKELGSGYDVFYEPYASLSIGHGVEYRIEVRDPEGYYTAFNVAIDDVDTTYDSIMNRIQMTLDDHRSFGLK